MSINYAKLRSVTVRQVIAALNRDGFLLDRQRSSHRHYRHPDERHVTISFHNLGTLIPSGTLKQINELQAKWTEEDLKRLKLL